MILIIRGYPGTGKTTAVKKLAESIKGCRGFYTEEVREKNVRIGFDVVTVDGYRFPLARTGPGKPRVGKYTVFLDQFDDFCRRFASEIEDQPGVLIIDELGKMELMSGAFRALISKVADFKYKTIVITAGATVRHPIIEQAHRLIEINPENRDKIFFLLQDLVGEKSSRDRHK